MFVEIEQKLEGADADDDENHSSQARKAVPQAGFRLLCIILI